MKISGIYKIQSKIKPERCYIGSSIDISDRWGSHLFELKGNRHGNCKLQNHFNKYKESDLQFFVLLGCDKEDLIKTEQYFLDSCNPYFNILKNAGGTAGKEHSDETKLKMSITRKGMTVWIKGKHLSEATKKKLSEIKKGKPAWNKGKKMSLDTCKKMSESKIGISTGRTGSFMTTEGKKRMVEINKGNCYAKGYKHTDEWKKLRSESSSGAKNSFYGKHHTEETKQKLRIFKTKVA